MCLDFCYNELEKYDTVIGIGKNKARWTDAD